MPCQDPKCTRIHGYVPPPFSFGKFCYVSDDKNISKDSESTSASKKEKDNVKPNALKSKENKKINESSSSATYSNSSSNSSESSSSSNTSSASSSSSDPDPVTNEVNANQTPSVELPGKANSIKPPSLNNAYVNVGTNNYESDNSMCTDSNCTSCNCSAKRDPAAVNARFVFLGIAGALVVLMVSYLVYIKYKTKGSAKKFAPLKEFSGEVKI